MFRCIQVTGLLKKNHYTDYGILSIKYYGILYKYQCENDSNRWNKVFHNLRKDGSATDNKLQLIRAYNWNHLNVNNERNTFTVERNTLVQLSVRLNVRDECTVQFKRAQLRPMQNDNVRFGGEPELKSMTANVRAKIESRYVTRQNVT